MENYYKAHLSSTRLRRAYDLAPPRVRQYLEAEIAFVAKHLKVSDIVLELGSGYGRVMKKIADEAGFVIGIDTSIDSLRAAAGYLRSNSNTAFVQMDAGCLGFPDKSMDCVICIQNGISAFHIDPVALVRESLRITKPSGLMLFSSYAASFWEDRLEWFRIQSENGLIGKIDWNRTKNGQITCLDGFSANTIGPDDFKRLLSPFGLSYEIREIDNSSLFCIIKAN